MSRGTVLITRPAEAAEKTAQALRERGWEPLVAPVTSIRFLSVSLPDLSACDALIFTSAQGVAAYTIPGGGQNLLPVYAVGPATAAAARRAGFADVRTGPGTAQALEEMFLHDKSLKNKTFFHFSGDPAAHVFHLPEARVERHILYRAEAEKELPPLCRDYLEKGRVDVALFYSPRAAALFSGLLESHGLTQAAASIKALCLADSVVKSLQYLPWRDICLAASPDGESMLAALDDIDL